MPGDRTLTRTQMNAVLMVIESRQMVALDFSWEEETFGHPASGYFRCSKLRHRPTGHWFVFGGDFLKLSPGERDKVFTSHTERYLAWVVVIATLGNWLGRVKREHEAPDLWAMVSQSSVPTAAEQEDNRPITPDERRRIEQALDQIKGHLLQTQEFSTAQQETINERFQYIGESLDRIEHKRDWLMFFWGTLVNVLVALSVSTQTGTDLLNYAQAALQWMTGTLPQLH